MKILTPILAFILALQQSSVQVDVRLQQFVVTVRDSKGNLVRHLHPDDFRIEENGESQPVAFFTEGTDEHVSLGILIDISGSMALRSGGMSRLSAAEGAARVLMRLMKPQDEFMLMTFDNKFNVNRKFTENPESIESALMKLEIGGGTDLFGGISTALRKMKEAKYRKRALVVITDGLAGGNLESLVQEIRNTEVAVYTFGLGSDLPEANVAPPFAFFPVNSRLPAPVKDPQQMMKTIAEESGGHSEYFDVGDLDDAVRKMVEFDRVIAVDLRGQYTLAYYPKSAFPAIRVRARDSSYTINTRRLPMEVPTTGK
jgi:Ca-activated chloride channel family protein